MQHSLVDIFPPIAAAMIDPTPLQEAGYNTGLFACGKELDRRLSMAPDQATLHSFTNKTHFRDRYSYLAYAVHETLGLSLAKTVNDTVRTEDVISFMESDIIDYGLRITTRLVGICAIKLGQEAKKVSTEDFSNFTKENFRGMVGPFARMDGLANSEAEAEYGLRFHSLEEAADNFIIKNDTIVPLNWLAFETTLYNEDTPFIANKGCPAYTSILKPIWDTLVNHCAAIEWLAPYDLQSSNSLTETKQI